MEFKCEMCGNRVLKSSYVFCPICGIKIKKSDIVAMKLVEEKLLGTSKSQESVTLGMRQAVKSAKSYLEVSSFSKQRLIKQLEHGGFTHEQAEYGVNNCGANWYEQAVKSARSYLEVSSFSKQRLIQQLEHGGFTHDQAVYGVEQIGY